MIKADEDGDGEVDFEVQPQLNVSLKHSSLKKKVDLEEMKNLKRIELKIDPGAKAL